MARLSSAERDNPAPFNFFFVREREREKFKFHSSKIMGRRDKKFDSDLPPLLQDGRENNERRDDLKRSVS